MENLVSSLTPVKYGYESTASPLKYRYNQSYILGGDIVKKDGLFICCKNSEKNGREPKFNNLYLVFFLLENLFS